MRGMRSETKGSTGMSTCYRPPDLEDEAFFRQQEDVLVLMVNCNYASICWKGIIVGHKQYSELCVR